MIAVSVFLVVAIWSVLMRWTGRPSRRTSLVLVPAAVLFASGLWCVGKDPWQGGLLLVIAMTLTVGWLAGHTIATGPGLRTDGRHPVDSGAVELAAAALALRDAGCDADWIKEYVTMGASMPGDVAPLGDNRALLQALAARWTVLGAAPDDVTRAAIKAYEERR